jgi:hypothetical protein
MKIRFYHWWLYWAFCMVWNPIFASNIRLAREFIRLYVEWLDEHDAKIREKK